MSSPTCSCAAHHILRSDTEIQNDCETAHSGDRGFHALLIVQELTWAVSLFSGGKLHGFSQQRKSQELIHFGRRGCSLRGSSSLTSLFLRKQLFIYFYYILVVQWVHRDIYKNSCSVS
jgi:hypothetical protein